MLHSVDLDPFELVHSRLVGESDTVTLYYTSWCQARFDKDNDPVRHFFENTRFLSDMKKVFNDEKLSKIDPIKTLLEKTENSKNEKSIRDACLRAIASDYRPLKMVFTEYDNKRCSVETSFELKSKVKDIFNVDKETINAFHIVVHTAAGKIQSTEKKK